MKTSAMPVTDILISRFEKCKKMDGGSLKDQLEVGNALSFNLKPFLRN